LRAGDLTPGPSPRGRGESNEEVIEIIEILLISGTREWCSARQYILAGSWGDVCEK
jgi:hypothetical protein